MWLTIFFCKLHISDEYHQQAGILRVCFLLPNQSTAKKEKRKKEKAWKDQIWVSIFSSNRLGPQGHLIYLLSTFWLKGVSLIIPHNKRFFLERIFMPLKGVSTKQKQILSLTLHTWKMAFLWTMRSNEFQDGKLQWSSHYYFSGVKMVSFKGKRIYSTPKLNCGNYACQNFPCSVCDGRHVKKTLSSIQPRTWTEVHISNTEWT